MTTIKSHNHRWLWWALASAALLGLAAPAHGVNLSLGAEPLRLDITETFLFSYHLDNRNDTYADDRYYELQSRLNLGVAYRRLRLAVRVDSAGYFNHPSCDDAGVCTHPSPPPAEELAWWPALQQGELRDRYDNHYYDQIGPVYMPERLSLTYTSKRVEVTLGDHYVSLGRGLVLSLRKVDELGSDTDLRGGRVIVRHGPVGATLVGGVTNIVNVDEATGRSSPDPLDAIVGGEARGTIKELVTVAGRGALVLYHRNSLAGQASDDRAILGGASVEAPRLGKLGSAYVEYARASTRLVESSAGGDAVYAAFTHYRGPLSLLLEGKFYRAFPTLKTSLESPSDSFTTIRYNNPPTVERILAELDSPGRVLNIGGGRLQGDLRVTPDLSCYLNYGYFHDWTDPGALLDIHDPYAGVKLSWQEHRSHAQVSFGTRFSQERESADPAYPTHPAQTHSLDGHVEVVASQALTRRFSLELTGRHRYRQRRELIDLQRWNEGEWALGVRWSPHLIVAGGYEYTTDPAKPHPPCGAVGQPVCETYHRLDYPNGQIAWTFMPGSTARLFVGGQRGGLRCVSGVCRVFPPFMGVKAEAVVRF